MEKLVLIPVQEAQALRAEGKLWREIAAHYGVSLDYLRRRVDPEYARRRRATKNARRYLAKWGPEPEAPPPRVSYRIEPLEPMSLTASLMGDPPPSRSALAQRESR